MTGVPPVPTRVRAHAGEFPGRPAFPGATLGEVAGRADALAGRLALAGVQPGDVVAVTGDDADAVAVAPLAVWWCGAALLPIPSSTPAPRVRAMLAVTGARVAVVTGDTPLVVPTGIRTVDVRDLAAARSTPSPPVALPGADPAGLAYIICTSGSTGTPKAVAVRHGPFADHIDAMIGLLGLTERDTVTQFASPGFDVALEETWTALAAGAALVPRAGRLWSPADLLALTVEHAVTVWQLPTAYWATLVDHVSAHGAATPPPSLRCVVIGSEAAGSGTARAWLRSPWGAVRLVNGYGPTETVVTATAYEVPRDPAALVTPILPIGGALPGRRTHVLDAQRRPVPDGESGELYVSGACLADGYLGDPDTTAASFIRLPDGTRAFRTGDWVSRRPDGCLDFHGRRDRQVKIGGVRIELAEVEAVLATAPGVASAVVRAVDGGPAARLEACVQSSADPTTWPELAAQVRRYAAAHLPPGAVPATVTVGDSLPVTANGKLDRTAPDHAALDRTAAAERLVLRRITGDDRTAPASDGPAGRRGLSELMALRGETELTSALRELLGAGAPATALVPVIEAVRTGLDPLVGWAAGAVRVTDGRIVLDTGVLGEVSTARRSLAAAERCDADLERLVRHIAEDDRAAPVAPRLRSLLSATATDAATGEPARPDLAAPGPEDVERAVALVRRTAAKTP
jgi:amino acid adenylation domain-containing protein